MVSSIERSPRRSGRRLAGIVLVVHAMAAMAAGQDSARLSDEWKRVRSANFEVVGNTSDGNLRSSLQELERFRYALTVLFPDLRLEATVPTVMVVFKNDAAFTPFKPRDSRGRLQRNVAGYFRQQPDRNYMVAATQPDRSQTLDVILHEYMHFVLHRGATRLPAWVDEGVAEFYSTYRTHTDGRGIIGEIPPWRRQTLRSAPLLPLDLLITDEGAARSRREGNTARFYAAAWTLVHYLTVGDRAGQLATYVSSLNRGMSTEQAFETAFKTTSAGLYGELVAYLRKPTLSALTVTFPETLITERPAVERMLEVEALQIQGDLMSDRADAVDLLKKSLAIDAAFGPSRVSLGRILLADKQTDEAVTVLTDAADAEPDSFAAHYWRARALGEARRHEEALAAASKATALNRGSPDAWLTLSMMALAIQRNSQADAAFRMVRQIDSSPRWFSSRAHQAFGVGLYDVIGRDVEGYIRDTGWDESHAAYMAFLGVIAHRRQQQAQEANRLLDGLIAAVHPESWQFAVARFLQGTMTAKQLLDRADGRGEETEARAYIGLNAAVNGNREEALLYLRWVRDRGERNYTEYGLAIDELRRLEAN